jgi:peptidoglycan/xylan/chitin deacetylase (PgdA/CDA1 family)
VAEEAPLLGIAVLALSHALVLYPTLSPNVQWLGPVITRFAAEGSEVWLTIDDGPTDDTPALLDLLDTRGVKATFFLKGELVDEHPERAREIVARGHEVANHSHSHPSAWFWCLPPDPLANEIERCNRALLEATDKLPRLFRAPVGMKNPGVHPQLRRRGLTLVGWTGRGFDSIESDCEKVASRIVPRVDAGAIVVMHQGREHSIRCIARVIDELQQRGYSFIVPELGRLKTKR